MLLTILANNNLNPPQNTAVQQSTRSYTYENVVDIRRPWATAAAALLVISTYIPASDMSRATAAVRRQAAYTVDPETFPQQQTGSLVLHTTYDRNADVRRQPQAQWFTEPEVFGQQAPQTLVVTLTTYSQYNPATDAQRARQAKDILEAEAFAQQQLGYVPVLLTSGPPGSFANDPNRLLKKQPVFAEPEVFAQQQRPAVVALTTYATYNPATDVRRARQPQVFSQPVVTISVDQMQVAPYQGTVPYNYAANDPRRPQAKVFTQPSVVISTSQGQIKPAQGTVPVYNPAIDRRIKQQQFFAEPETFPQQWVPPDIGVNSHGPESSDLFNGWDTYGWDENVYTVFMQEQGATIVNLTTYIPYSWQTDRRSPQQQWFADPEMFAKQQVAQLNTITPFNYKPDAFRIRQAIWFEDQLGEGRVFVSPAPFSQLIINGTSASIYMPLQISISRLSNAGLIVDPYIAEVSSMFVPQGYTVAQSIPAGTVVPQWTVVTLTVSMGKPNTPT